MSTPPHRKAAVVVGIDRSQAWDLQRFVWPREGAYMSRPGSGCVTFGRAKMVIIAWRLFTGGLGVKTRALVDWMKSQGKAGELADVNWQEMDLLTVPDGKFLPLAGAFGKFFKVHTKAELCGEALARGLCLSQPVLQKICLLIPSLKPEITGRKFDYPELETSITYPGALYKSSEIEWEFRRAPLIGEHNREFYEEELGFTKETLTTLKQRGLSDH